MYKTYILVVFVLVIVIFNGAMAQSDSLISQWAELLEDDAELVESLQQYLEQPLNINQANKEKLLGFPFITPQMADSIISTRIAKTRFSSKRDIRKIVGPENYELIKDFITISSARHSSNTVLHRSRLAVENIKEVDIHRYSGNAWSVYNKIYFSHNPNLKGGIITQKDVGEASYWDYLSGYVEYNSESWRMIVGSYYLHFGQGLVFSNPFGQRKSSIVTMPFRNMNFGGFASLSSSENTGNFGLYLKNNLPGGVVSHLYFASNKRDGRYQSDTGSITGFNYVGYHRTLSEENRKDIINETVYGLALIKPILNRSLIGIALANHSYSPRIETIKDKSPSSFRREFYNFSGNQVQQSTIFYRLAIRNMALDGEVALSGTDQQQAALSQSFLIKGPNVSVGLKYWRSGRNFQSPSGRIFDDSDPFPQSKEGWYAAINIAPARKVNVRLYRIVHKDLWRTYFSHMPLKKAEWLIQADYAAKPIILTARFRTTKKEKYVKLNSGSGAIISADQKILRWEVQYIFGRYTRFKTRWEGTQLGWINESGSNIFQDMQTRIFPWLKLNIRLSYFRTASYASRIYEYESDIPGTFSNYPLYGDGNKWYIMLKTEPLPNLYFWVKYRYYQQNTVQPDLFEFRPSPILLKRSLHLQFQYRF